MKIQTVLQKGRNNNPSLDSHLKIPSSEALSSSSIIGFCYKHSSYTMRQKILTCGDQRDSIVWHADDPSSNPRTLYVSLNNVKNDS